MVQGITSDIKCDPVSETNNRTTQRASARPVHSYERRPRRKTKTDRYESYKEPSISEQGSPRPRHSQKRTILMKRNNSRVAEKFRAKNIKAGRLTLTSNQNIGIFKKGKTSSPISSVKVSYPNFSELQFLAKESQTAIVEEEARTPPCLEQHGILSSGSAFDVFVEKELLQILTDCRQLNVAYEEYRPRYPNWRFTSLEDLKDLCRERDNMWLERKEKNAFDNAMDNDSHGIRHASFGRTRTEDAYFSISGNNAAENSAQREEMLDMLLQSVEDFDEDVALEVLAEVAELGADRYELQPPGRTDYAYDMEAIRSKYLYDIPRMLEEDCGDSAAMGHGEHSVISSTTQRRYNDNMKPIGCHIWDQRDMETAAKVKASALGISSALDDRQFQSPQKPTPPQSITHIPVDAAVQNPRSNATSRRPFWRCNKLY